ncbi:MFS transporter [Philodulcilactobacillus myokoensis]|uniref:MFS transporter n=1 Tax=Philodulcilactobacillus myokoensis TaxID=2929573 RepID=A0A9W6B2D6_9LACO|nr:MFS transporter [Philodulcilactobacillus myokoensis]GLB47531.1 MFS transporter [Philodulcilactobacillus myokoensis]
MILNKLSLIKTYFTSYFLYNLGRVLPHAVLTVILLNKGMTVGDIAVIQGFFMLACIIFSFPSGVLTDIWSEKMTYITSLVLLLISYYIIMISSDFPLLCMSWFIYGISSATMGNSLDMYFLRSYQNNGKQIKKFNVHFNSINLYSTLIGGGIGSFIYEGINNGIYILSILLIIVSGLIVLVGFKNVKTKKIKENSVKKILVGFKYVFAKRNTLINIILMAVFQIIMELFIQFWQVILLNVHFNQKYFGFFYVAFQIVAILSNYIFKRFNWQNDSLIFVIIIGCFFVFMNMVSNKLVFILILGCFLIPFNLYTNQLTLNIQRQAPSQMISSVMSLTDTICSVVSMISLWSIGIMNKVWSFKLIALLMVIVFILISIGLLLIQAVHTKEHVTNE